MDLLRQVMRIVVMTVHEVLGRLIAIRRVMVVRIVLSASPTIGTMQSFERARFLLLLVLRRYRFGNICAFSLVRDHIA